MEKWELELKTENWTLNRKVNANEREASEKGPAKTSTFSPATVVLFTCSLNFMKRSPKLAQFIHKSRHIFFWNSPVLSTQQWIASKCIPPPSQEMECLYFCAVGLKESTLFWGSTSVTVTGWQHLKFFLRCCTWPRPGVGEGPGSTQKANVSLPVNKISSFITWATYVALRTYVRRPQKANPNVTLNLMPFKV